MHTEQTFWRLLADYERLTRDETAALRGQDWDGVADVQARKPVLFSALCEVAAGLGLDRANPALRARLELLSLAEQTNAAWLAEQLSSTRTQQRELNASQQRARGFGHAYARGDRAEVRGEMAWVAHG